MIFRDRPSPASSSDFSFDDSADPSQLTSLFDDDDDAGSFSLTWDSPAFASKQMSAAAFADQWAVAPLGGGFSGPFAASEDSFFDWQSQQQQHVDLSTSNFLGAMPHPQRSISAHRRRLSHSSIPSQSSASPYTQPATLKYPIHQQQQHQGIDPSSQFIEPGYSAYQSPQFQAHNLPTPTGTPTSDTFSERSQRRSQTTMPSSKLAMAQNHQSRNIAQQQYVSGDSNAWQANSMYSQELPNTPRTLGGGDESDEAYHSSALRNVPKFDRTMSEVYENELYLSRQNTRQQQVPQNYNMLSPYPQNWTQQQKPADSISREDNSPFRQNAQWMQSQPNGFGDGQIGTAARMRQQQKEEADALAYQQHMTQTTVQPKTISPKDVVNHDYHNPEEPPPPSLFPESSIPENSVQDESFSAAAAASNGRRGDYYRQTEVSLPRQGAQVPTSNFNFVATNPASGTQFPGGKGFAPPTFRYQNSSSGQMPDFAPPQLVSMDTSASEDNAASDAPIERPASTTADSGTYTCTYHGCTQRFESPAKLQKHKREDHRSAHHGHGSSQPVASSATPELVDRNSQAGPHKCERTNPTTGKPCNTIFSRPYDLTRHEDTIHNAKKKKVRCQHCTEEKTFSRADALSRHMRVVHPDIEFPGKHGRRRHD